MLPRGRHRGGSRSPWLALAFVLVTLLLPRLAAASPATEPHQVRPVIVPGREQEVMALLHPYDLGDAVAPGWTLESVSIDVGTITIQLAGPEPEHAALTLDHPDHRPPRARMLTGFALAVVDPPPDSAAAVAAIVAALERNDDGSFWGEDPVYAGEPREHPHPSALDDNASLKAILTWTRDGVVFFAALTLILLGLVVHKLRGAPAWMKWALLGTVALAATLRLLLSPAVALAPWPYTRLLVSARMLFHGPGLAALHPEPVWLDDVVLDSTLGLALLAPLAVYAHARYLLDDHRAGLCAALVVAILPLHLRFSHSDTAFIPSITVSSTVFALIHAATRERDGRWGWAAVGLVGFPLVLMYEVRPLNIMYYPLLLATAFVRQGLHGDKPPLHRTRTVAVFVLVSVVTFGLGVPQLLADFGPQVDEGLSLSTLGSGLLVLTSVHLNALVNPVFSPPGLTALAVIGVVDLWRRGRRALLSFLLAWLLGLLFAHAYVVPGSMYMQARYHLHLVVPYVLLVVAGADAGLRWLARGREQGSSWLAGVRHRLVVLGALAYGLASPLVHRHGIVHVQLNDVREWIFVHELREVIPARCTVIEYTGPNAGMRLRRVGSWVQDGVPRERWRVVEIPSPRPGQPSLPESIHALLRDPPECLYVYEGLPCFGHKTPLEPRAAACRAIAEQARLEPVATTRFPSVPYDENLSRGLLGDETIELRLSRVRARR